MATDPIEEKLGLPEALKVMQRRAEEVIRERPDLAVQTHRDIAAMIDRLYKKVLPVRTRPFTGGDPEPLPGAAEMQQAIGVLVPWQQKLTAEIRDWPSVQLRPLFEAAVSAARVHRTSTALGEVRASVNAAIVTWTKNRDLADEKLRQDPAVQLGEDWAKEHAVVRNHVTELEALLVEVDAAISKVARLG